MIDPARSSGLVQYLVTGCLRSLSGMSVIAIMAVMLLQKRPGDSQLYWTYIPAAGAVEGAGSEAVQGRVQGLHRLQAGAGRRGAHRQQGEGLQAARACGRVGDLRARSGRISINRDACPACRMPPD